MQPSSNLQQFITTNPGACEVGASGTAVFVGALLLSAAVTAILLAAPEEESSPDVVDDSEGILIITFSEAVDAGAVVVGASDESVG